MQLEIFNWSIIGMLMCTFTAIILFRFESYFLLCFTFLYYFLMVTDELNESILAAFGMGWPV